MVFVKTAVRFFGGWLWLASLVMAADKPPLPHTAIGVANGCFVETVAMLDAWQEKMGVEPWAKLLRWGAKEDEEVVAGHAVAVVEARGRLWCWDGNFGWTALGVDAAQREQVGAVVVPIVARYARVQAQYPSYFADFPQPAGAPIAAQVASPNMSVRDATLVGERLARHRPVNVVTFSYGPDDNRRASAAAVFVYGGRYCVYVPEIGTVPARGHGSVENLRLIQQTLRRMCPGTGAVTKL
jgi:hypothetical protein